MTASVLAAHRATLNEDQPSGGSPRAVVDAYYNHTWSDYRVLWLGRGNLAIHFGYYDERHGRYADAKLNMNRVLARRAAIQPMQRVPEAGCSVVGAVRQYRALKRGDWFYAILSATKP